MARIVSAFKGIQMDVLGDTYFMFDHDVDVLFTLAPVHVEDLYSFFQQHIEKFVCDGKNI